jgi:phage repressor protein C with HTH and peptisase S24 domain
MSRADAMPGKIFAFSIGSSIIIRRLDIRPGRYILMSDDPRHTSLEIELLNFEEVKIIGQVIWVFRELR